jgi:hypothetical protein
MANYLFLYTGGSPPASEAEGQKVMAAWMSFFNRMGDRIVDGGTPLGDRQGVAGTAPTGATGYSILRADSLAEAVSYTEDHPHILSGGGIEVIETVPVQM